MMASRLFSNISTISIKLLGHLSILGSFSLIFLTFLVLLAMDRSALSSLTTSTFFFCPTSIDGVRAPASGLSAR